jgi:alpha-1,3-rhamnosyltransferase
MPGSHEKLVSVIIPFYNGKAHIEEAILSVLNQTYKNIEIVVIDDCSPSKKDREFIIELSTKYDFKLHCNNYNRGTSSSIASGIEQSNGDFISIFSHDDIYVKDKIEKQINYLNEYPEKCCVYGAMKEFNSNSNKTRTRSVSSAFSAIDYLRKLNDDEILKNFFLDGIKMPFYIQTLLVKRDLALQELVPIWYKSKADVFPIKFHLCLNHINEIGIINEPLTLYRKHNSNVSSDNLKMFELNLDTIMKFCPPQFQKQAIARILPLIGDCQEQSRGLLLKDKINKFLKSFLS